MRTFAPVLLVLLAVPLAAQEDVVRIEPLGDRPRLYLAGGINPGVGVAAFASLPTLTVFTREAALYADYVPRVTGGSGRLLTAVGVGAGVRALRVLQIVQDVDPGRVDIDVGVRIGPSFYTAFFEQTAASEARAFAVFLDPFARGTVRIERGLVLFAEIGTQAPSLRAGLSTSIRRPQPQ